MKIGELAKDTGWRPRDAIMRPPPHPPTGPDRASFDRGLNGYRKVLERDRQILEIIVTASRRDSRSTNPKISCRKHEEADAMDKL